MSSSSSSTAEAAAAVTAADNSTGCSSSSSSSIYSYTGSTFGVPATASKKRKRISSELSADSPWFLSFGSPNFNVWLEDRADEDADVLYSIDLDVMQKKRRNKTRTEEVKSRTAELASLLQGEKEKETAVQQRVYNTVCSNDSSVDERADQTPRQRLDFLCAVGSLIDDDECSCSLKDSWPFKALVTNEGGFVERLIMEAVDFKRPGIDGDGLMKTLRASLVEFQNRRRYQHSAEYVCTVMYLDNEREDLTLEALDLLSKSKTWRSQLLLVQGYVPSQEPPVRGVHNTINPNRSNAGRKDDTAAHLTTVLAHCAEKAYSSVEGASIRDLQAVFARDVYGQLVFLYAEALEVGYGGARSDSRALKAERTAQLESSAKEVASELYSLLTHAQTRGLGPEGSFAHFDTSGLGFVDVDSLADGLARLGIGVIHPVVEALVELIAGPGSSFMTLSDLERFLRPPAYVLAFEAAGSADLTSPLGYLPGTPGLSPSLPWRADARAASVKTQLQPIGETVGPSTLSPSKARSPSKASVAFDDSALKLPLPEEAYSHGLGKGSSAGSAPLRFRRHQAALRELSKPGVAATPAKSVVDPRLKIEAFTSAKDAETSMQLKSSVGASEELVRDELLHIENGLVIAFRIINAASKTRKAPQPSQTSSDLRHISYLQQIGDKLEKTSSRTEGGAETATNAAFTLIVLPDLFMTLDTLDAALQPLLTRHPGASLLLVGLAGASNTTWPSTTELDAQLHARCLSRLIESLQEGGRLSRSPLDSVFLLGFGLGGHYLAQFCATALPGLHRFVPLVKAVVLVNSFVKLGKSMRRVLEELSEALESSAAPELNELIASLHFWDDYCERIGRDKVMKEFWLSRRGLGSCDPADVSSGRHGYVGIQRQLRGVLSSADSIDEKAFLSVCTRPLVVVHATEDVFVDPRLAEALRRPEMLSENRFVVDEVESLREGALSFHWLKAGHEALQERTPFFLSLIGRLAKTFCGYVPSSRPATVSRPEAIYTPEAGIEETVEQDKSVTVSEIVRALKLPTSEEESSPPVQMSTTSDGLETKVEGRPSSALVDDSDQRLRRKHSRVERLRKAEYTAQLEYAKSLVRADQEAQREARAVEEMEREDVRSSLADAYVRYCADAARSAANAKVKAGELYKLRRAEAMRQVDEQLARQRAERVEERRRKADALLHEIENESMALIGEGSGGYDLGDAHQPDVVSFIEATRRLLGDYMECRQKAMQSLRRLTLLEEKMATFREHSAMLQADVRKLRRALRMAETNPSLVAGSHPIESQLSKMRANLAQKEQSYSEFSVIAKNREAQVAAANRNYQRFKQKLNGLEGVMSRRLVDMRSLDQKLGSRSKLLRAEQEELMSQKDSLMYKNRTVAGRKEALRKERERVGSHSGHFCDTDLWIEGVPQRCVTKELRRHLKREYELADVTLQEVEAGLSCVRGKLVECVEVVTKLKRDNEKVTLIAAVFGSLFSQLKSVSLVDATKELAKQYELAEKKETGRDGDNAATASIMASSEPVSSMAKVRAKEMEVRSADEKRMLALDVLLHPEAYADISTREAEEMQFDPLYTSDLSRSDAERVLKLPDKVSLALPFLHTNTELEAHRLMNKFYRDKDTDFFVREDYFADGSQGAEQANADSGLFSRQQMEAAESTHDMLLRESRRDRLRARRAADGLSADEVDWLLIDRILSPDVFEDDLDTEDEIDHKGEVELTSTSLSMGTLRGFKPPPATVGDPSSDRTMKDGDKYKASRVRFEVGDAVFEEQAWTCPFSRDEILRVRNLSAAEVTGDEDVRRVRYLLDKYFVSDDESVLGHQRLEIMHHVLRSISAISRHADETAGSSEAVDQEPKDGIETSQSSGIVRRLWGSWEQIHPAAGGLASQHSLFDRNTFSVARDHPAAYAVHSEAITRSDRLASLPLPPGVDLVSLGLATLQASSTAGVVVAENDPRSEWYTAESLQELATKDKLTVGGKVVIVSQKDSRTLLEVDDATLQSRQSRPHTFGLPDSDSLRVLELTVSILFQGSFNDRGYKLGRLAASLFRLPDERDRAESPLPRPVGFAPYDLITPNSPNSIGRLVIVHKPRVKPIRPGQFQIIVGAASFTKYSIQVTCRYAKLALPLVDEAVISAKEMQQRLPLCIRELDNLLNSLRIAERKLLICDKMISAADVETKRAQRKMRTITTKLEEDDEEMLLREDERRELQREVSVLEIEFAEWVAIFGSRCKEKAAIKEGIELMHAARIHKQQEKSDLKNSLHRLRADLPPCIELLRSVQEASTVAVALNASFAMQASSVYSSESSPAAHATPAEIVRLHFKLQGWRSLSLEEQQWSLLDQVMQPLKYEWLREKEEEENQRRLEAGKRPTKRKLAAVVEALRMSKVEIEHLLRRPYAMLSRKEALARKLIHRFHDDKDIMKQKHAESAYGFDVHLAERVRSKHVNTFSKEEREWASIDRILHAEVWRFYNHTEKQNFAARKDKGETTVLAGVHEELDAMGRILGLDANEFAQDGGDVRAAAESTQKALIRDNDKSRPYECGLALEDVRRIWRGPRDSLRTDEERYVYKLLHKYNGAAPSDEAANVQRIQGSNIQFHSKSSTVSADPDVRCHMLLNEIERATTSELPLIDSELLHSSNQRFPPEVLRLQLESELDRELMEQIMERERSERSNELSDSGSDSEDEAEEEPSGSVSKILTEKQQQRAARRKKRAQNLKRESFTTEVLRTTNLLTSRKSVSALALEDAKLNRELGAMGVCLACRTKDCQWITFLDTEACTHRMREIEVELERVKFDKETKVFSSAVALSAQLGGNTKFRRKDLLLELSSEYADLERRIRLDNIDRELHDAYASRREYIEIKHLHGYATMLWTTNARKALEAERSRLIATTTARDIVEDILDWMLEGWYFGERQSAHNTMGFVPSIKPEGIIVAGQDQIRATEASTERVRYRAELKRKGALPLAATGSHREKAQSIGEAANMRHETNKVAKEGTGFKKVLDETESTLRFGLFMLTLMYFRSMTYLSREKKTWSGEAGEVHGDEQKRAATQERIRMLEENNRVAARKRRHNAIMLRCVVGEQRRREREESERRESLARLQAVVRRQKLEAESVGLIQKVYRGHLDRKAVRRWALKKAELAAMFAVLNATAIFIQRVWRGFLGRQETMLKRLEMAHFIAMMRAQEADDDEFIYWQSHPWARMKRDWGNWAREKIGVRKEDLLGLDPLEKHLNDDV